MRFLCESNLSENCAYLGRSGRVGNFLWIAYRYAAPPGLAIQAEWTRVGQQFYQIKIADQHGSERIDVGRQKTVDIRPDRPG